MKVITTASELFNYCENVRINKRTVGFVPTMGYLHDGHLALIKRARELTDEVVVSIFVNPTQFGKNEDLNAYPKSLEKDLQNCECERVSVVFTPSVEEIYPQNFQTFVHVEGVSQGLCGEFRPGHFRGVATVVAKLFNMVGPCHAVFGEKDYQQLKVIQQLVRDLNMPVQIIPLPTVREPDGLAMSSRNSYLSASERQAATCIYRAMSFAKEMAENRGEIASSEIISAVKTILSAEAKVQIQYVEVRDPHTLGEKEHTVAGTGRLFIALFLGKTRLIDNMQI